MTALVTHLKDLIRADGPISVAEYMRVVLTGRDDSYYMRGEAFGAAGDFVTAPEISQIFGELVGLWCVDAWLKLGSPKRFSFVEFGPGRGTLMKDALRAARVAPGFLDAASVSLIEMSRVLRRLQADALHDAPIESLRWFDRFEQLDTAHGPIIVVANEFFDALPIRQFVRTERGWFERCVGLDATGALAFGAAPDQLDERLVPEALRGEPAGAVVEVAPARTALAHMIAERVARATGAVLVIDYGFAGPAAGETLQAVKRHAFADVLAEPGQADLTSHVDFTALARAFDEGGAHVLPLAHQGDFLNRLGAAQRIEALKRSATGAQVQQLDLAHERLTGGQAMGSLFKVLCAYAPASLQLSGF
jgi:NADH dehydrogenase [ubiquinone] 1 alpha subcomplex assembly factor 7